MSGHKPIDYAAVENRIMRHHMKLTREQREAVTRPPRPPRPEGRMAPYERIQQMLFLRDRERRVPYHVRAGSKAPSVRFAHIDGEPYRMPDSEVTKLRQHPRSDYLSSRQVMRLRENDRARILAAEEKRARRAAVRRQQAKVTP